MSQHLFPLSGLTATLPTNPAGDASVAVLTALGAKTDRCAKGAASIAGSGSAMGSADLSWDSDAKGELGLAAACGALLLTGELDRAPIWPDLPACQGLVGLATAATLLTRLHAPMAAAAPIDPVRWLVYLLGSARAQAETGGAPRRQGPGNPQAGPTALYPDTLLPCADGYVHAHSSPADPTLLTALLGEPVEVCERLAVGESAAAEASLPSWLAKRSRAEAAALAQELRHPFVGVDTLLELRARYSGAALPPPFEFTPLTPGLRLEQRTGPLPLTGIRVLEVGVAVAGPMAGELLALQGATVTRLVHPVAAAPGWYDSLKRTVTADLATAEGSADFERLLCQSDVLVTNLSARSQQHLGLTADRCGRLAPGLVMVSISAFPRSDPRYLWSAFDGGMQAATGLADATRYPGGPPLRVAGHPVDGATALTAVCAALAGLWQRKQTDAGCGIEVSMLGADLQLLGQALRSPRPPATNASGVFPVAGNDAWVAVEIPDQEVWERVRTIAKLSTPTAAALSAWTAQRAAPKVCALLASAGAQATPLVHVADLAHDARAAGWRPL